MPNSSSQSRSATLIGLAIALLGIPFIATIFGLAVPVTTSASQLVMREIAILALVVLLIWLIVKKERILLTSIGLFSPTKERTLLWGLTGFLALSFGTVIALGLLQLLGLTYGSGGSKFIAPIWATLLIVVRAGIAEEVFYRGFAIERLENLDGKSLDRRHDYFDLFCGVSLPAGVGRHINRSYFRRHFDRSVSVEAQSSSEYYRAFPYRLRSELSAPVADQPITSGYFNGYFALLGLVSGFCAGHSGVVYDPSSPKAACDVRSSYLLLVAVFAVTALAYWELHAVAERGSL